MSDKQEDLKNPAQQQQQGQVQNNQTSQINGAANGQGEYVHQKTNEPKKDVDDQKSTKNDNSNKELEQNQQSKRNSQISVNQQQNGQPYSQQNSNKDIRNGEESSKSQKNISTQENEESNAKRQSQEIPLIIIDKPNKVGNSPANDSVNQNHIQSASLGKILGEMKRTRQQAELEHAVLSSRLALLKQEEINSKKKIYQTKRQTFEYYILKKENEKMQNKKNRDDEDNKEKQRKRQQENERWRMQKREDRDNSRQSLLNYNKSNYDLIKQQQNENEERKRQFLERHTEENQKKKMHIQKQLLKGSLHINEYKNKLNERQLDNYRNQIKEEEHVKERKNYEIFQMEQLEYNLIKKLQATQKLQRRCFEELQGAITLRTEEFKAQYKPVFSRKKVHKMIANTTQSFLDNKDSLQESEKKMHTYQSYDNHGSNFKGSMEAKKNNNTEKDSQQDQNQTEMHHQENKSIDDENTKEQEQNNESQSRKQSNTNIKLEEENQKNEIKNEENEKMNEENKEINETKKENNNIKQEENQNSEEKSIKKIKSKKKKVSVKKIELVKPSFVF